MRSTESVPSCKCIFLSHVTQNKEAVIEIDKYIQNASFGIFRYLQYSIAKHVLTIDGHVIYSLKENQKILVGSI